jgi:hypothetical protein
MDQPTITIRSGGQTGADRAALDAAIELGIPYCGWCPKGRLAAEDGPIPAKYALQETRTGDYPERTRLNVEDSDGTVIFSARPLSGGTRVTAEICQELGKPLLVVEPADPVDREAARLRAFVQSHRIRVLNVAGPRASTDPGIYDFTRRVISCAFSAAAQGN